MLGQSRDPGSRPCPILTPESSVLSESMFISGRVRFCRVPRFCVGQPGWGPATVVAGRAARARVSARRSASGSRYRPAMRRTRSAASGAGSPGARRCPCLEDASLSQHQDDGLAAARTGPQQAAQQVTKRNWPPSSPRACNRVSGCSDVSSWHRCRARRGVPRIPAGVGALVTVVHGGDVLPGGGPRRKR